MPRFIDARIPVVFGALPGDGDAVLPEDGAVLHPAGCACCAARTPRAASLDQLFLDRVRGRIPWFQRVVVTGNDPALRDALAADPVLAARFRLG